MPIYRPFQYLDTAGIIRIYDALDSETTAAAIYRAHTWPRQAIISGCRHC